MIDITQEFVRYLFWYDPSSGILRWRNPRSNNRKPWSLAGCSSNSTGYVQLKIGNDVFSAHRLIWLYVYGEMANGEIDHINRIRSDNRIVNLRVVTRSENLQNKSLEARNKTGIKGVRFYADHKKWRAQITVNKKQIHLGTFDTFEGAMSARIDAQKSMHIQQIGV